MALPLVRSSANELSGSLTAGTGSVSLGPVGLVSGAAPPAFNNADQIPYFNQTYDLDPTSLIGPTLNVALTNVVTDAASSGISIDNISTKATSDAGSANFLLTENPTSTLSILGLSVSATMVHSEAGASYVFGPDVGSLSGAASFGSLTISGALIGKTLTFSGNAAANTILYNSPTVTITLDKQTLSDFLPPGATPPFAPNQIVTDALDIHFNNATEFGRPLSGDITLGVASASLFPPLHIG